VTFTEIAVDVRISAYWLSGPGTPQFSVRACPDILAAERQGRRLLRCCTAEQLIYSRIHAAAAQDDHEWKRRTLALIESNPRQVTESSAPALFEAAAYPGSHRHSHSQPAPPGKAHPEWLYPRGLTALARPAWLQPGFSMVVVRGLL
jgi:hypothetical protein